MFSVPLYSPFALVDKTFPECLFFSLVVLLGTQSSILVTTL